MRRSSVPLTVASGSNGVRRRRWMLSPARCRSCFFLPSVVQRSKNRRPNGGEGGGKSQKLWPVCLSSDCPKFFFVFVFVCFSKFRPNGRRCSIFRHKKRVVRCTFSPVRCCCRADPRNGGSTPGALRRLEQHPATPGGAGCRKKECAHAQERVLSLRCFFVSSCLPLACLRLLVLPACLLPAGGGSMLDLGAAGWPSAHVLGHCSLVRERGRPRNEEDAPFLLLFTDQGVGRLLSRAGTQRKAIAQPVSTRQAEPRPIRNAGRRGRRRRSWFFLLSGKGGERKQFRTSGGRRILFRQGFLAFVFSMHAHAMFLFLLFCLDLRVEPVWRHWRKEPMGQNKVFKTEAGLSAFLRGRKQTRFKPAGAQTKSGFWEFRSSPLSV